MYELNKIREEKLKKIFEEELHQDPQNIYLLFKLALLEIEPPRGDDVKCTKHLEQILAFDIDNAQALILLAYLKNTCLFEEADEHFMNKLTSLKSSSNELNSMLRYVASCFFQFKGNREKQIFFLEESIALDPENVWSYFDLAQRYFSQSKNLEAKELIHKALKNIKKVYDDSFDDYDKTSLNDFLNHNIKGIYVTKEQKEIIEEMLDR
ncbi:hypothetical protein IPF37_05965 [bacterium]|nr:MAG: hypothetical protein IPF37_05965 [bacterium]